MAGKVIFHLHPIYPASYKAEDGVATTNDKNVTCPECLENMSPHDERQDLEIQELLQLTRKGLSRLEAALWGFEKQSLPIDRVKAEAAEVTKCLAIIVDNCSKKKATSTLDAKRENPT